MMESRWPTTFLITGKLDLSVQKDAFSPYENQKEVRVKISFSTE
jgi:hypothetical protein